MKLNNTLLIILWIAFIVGLAVLLTYWIDVSTRKSANRIFEEEQRVKNLIKKFTKELNT
jgi:hypothetical protein